MAMWFVIGAGGQATALLIISTVTAGAHSSNVTLAVGWASWSAAHSRRRGVVPVDRTCALFVCLITLLSLPAPSALDTLQLGRSSLFAGNLVHLDDARWSAGFEAQVSSWASSATLLLVMETGEAMLSVQGDSSASSASVRNDSQSTPSAAVVAARPRQMELCAVFRFENGAAGPVLPTACLALAFSPAGAQLLDRGLVQLSPNALFRYYWRRHALTLRYPSPSEHVEEDAMALLRYVVSRVRLEGRGESANVSPGRSRHRTLAQNAKALMALTIADPHPIAHVARALDTSPFHLAHVFRTEVGSSPHRYLVQLRLIAALVQLRAGARDLSKLALDLGFCHHSHFTAVFRQALKYTPREVRRMLTAECIADLGIAARPCS